MKVKVWIKGHEDEFKEIELKESLSSRPFGDRITPMDVKDYLCHNEFFSWADYDKIRYQRMKS